MDWTRFNLNLDDLLSLDFNLILSLDFFLITSQKVHEDPEAHPFPKRAKYFHFAKCKIYNFYRSENTTTCLPCDKHTKNMLEKFLHLITHLIEYYAKERKMHHAMRRAKNYF